MKRLIALLLIMLLAFSLLTACGGNDMPNNSSPNSGSSGGSNSSQGGENDSEGSQSEPYDTYQDDFDESNEDLKLSGVLYDFTFKLEGDTITLPLKLGELYAIGWEPAYRLAETMGSSTFSAATFMKNGKEAMFYFSNPGDGELALHECFVHGISSYYYDDYISDDVNEDFAVIELPKGIILGKSTVFDVRKAYGDPTYTYFTNDYELEQTLVHVYDNEAFRKGTWFGVEITTDIRMDNIVTAIDISNSVR